MSRGPDLGRGKRFISAQRCPDRVHQAFYALRTGSKGVGVKLTAHLHLAPILRMSSTIPQLSIYVFVDWDNFTIFLNRLLYFANFRQAEQPECE
jgi:hypothetical protein